MKRIAIRLICVLAALAPTAASAQSNIQAAFDAIINCTDAEISDDHFSAKDPKTNLKSEKHDIYYFTIPDSKKKLINNVLDAFVKDENTSYLIKKGKSTGRGGAVNLFLAESSSIIMDEPENEYIYELFAPSKSEDPKGIHRYAYGFNYKEEDGIIKGKMVISYATTGEYRQQAERQRQLNWMTELDKANKKVNNDDSEQSWFEQVMACINGLKDANDKTRIALATKAYKLVGNIEDYDVSSQDKTTIKKMFEITLSNPAYSDPILYELLKQCQAGIK